MTIQQYALVDKETNIISGTVMWDGDVSTWAPPETQYAVVEADYQYMVWKYDLDLQEWVLAADDPFNPGDEVGAMFDGNAFITTEPKPQPLPPANDQPTNTGTVTI